jgi:hypothetical protein
MIVGYFAPIIPGHENQFPQFLAPFIKIAVSDSDNLNNIHIVENKLSALIDTGAELCRIDSGLIEKHKFISKGQVESNNAGVISNISLYVVQIVMEDSTVLQLTCASSPLRSSGQSVDFLFGMDAIRFFALTVAKSRQEVTLQYLGQ